MEIRLGQSYSFLQTGRRGNQEDSRYPDCDAPDRGQRFFVVCDGVGGCAKGEVASRTVCDSFGKTLGGKHLEDMNFDNSMFSEVLDAAYDALDRKTDGSNRGMATTLTFVCVHKGGCTMAHIGDSRIYHVRPGNGILYRSDDHSLVNSMVHSGIITPEEAVNYPQSNVITRCMEAVDADQNRSAATVTLTTDILPGDYFFMCTDGVLHCLGDEELVGILDRETDDMEKMKYIAGKCAESSDNNTAILIPVAEVTGDETSAGSFSGQNMNITHRMEGRGQISSEVVSVQRTEPANRFVRAFKRVFCK